MNIKNNIQKGFLYLKRNGIKETVYQTMERIEENRKNKSYHIQTLGRWISREELERQSQEEFAHPVTISILVPTYETPEEYLRQMIDSVLNQSYENLELCIADGSESNEVETIVSQYVDERIQYKHLKKNRGISENTNEALKMATGEYIALLDHDDFLELDALYQIVKKIDKGAQVIYSDEDKVDGTGKDFFCPHYKENFNIDLFLSNNYICHLFCVKTEIAKSIGGFRSEYNGAQDYDFILRCIESIKEKEIAHIDRILYHWRAHALSTADNPQSKMYAYEAGLHVLEDYLKRNDYSGTVSHTKHLGYYRIDYHQKASQEYVLYVDEKLKPLTANYEEIMKSYLERENIGAVGGKIYGKNGKIISAGYFKNKDGKIESYHYGLNRHYSGYMHKATIQRDVEAVSRNAILVRKEFADALSMDSYKLCEMIRKSGYLVVFDPNIEFILK